MESVEEINTNYTKEGTDYKNFMKMFGQSDCCFKKIDPEKGVIVTLEADDNKILLYQDESLMFLFDFDGNLVNVQTHHF